jgi:hypothetical protein
MTYSKLSDFSFGVSILTKTNATFTADKELFTTIFQSLDLTNPNYYDTKSVVLQYIDINFILSTRARFIEKSIPAVEKIFVGLGTHFYLPTFFAKSDGQIQITSGQPNSYGIIDNYQMRVTGTTVASSNKVITSVMSVFPQSYEYLSPLLYYGGSGAFGLGFDLGFIVQFNRFVKIGFASTDIGFIVFPNSVEYDIDFTVNLDLDSAGSFQQELIYSLLDEYSDMDNASSGETVWWMPNTCIRFGVAVTPFKKDIFIWSSDVSLSDMNRLLGNGYPTFSFSTGIEFKPSINWFAVPMRMAFNYNSQANAASFSFGLGFYLGPVELEFAVKGLEILIYDFGAKELCAGFDLKFEF